jgi:hypothetical protein
MLLNLSLSVKLENQIVSILISVTIFVEVRQSGEEVIRGQASERRERSGSPSNVQMGIIRGLTNKFA